LGEGGTGKTTLLRVFADELRRSGRPVATASLLGAKPAEFLWAVATGWGANPVAGLGTPSLWRIVTDRMAEYRYQQLDAVLLVDDADQATAEVLTQVTRLAKHDPSPESRLTMVLAGRERRMARLGPSLMDLAELRIDLDGWEQSDTETYVQAMLAQTGRSPPAFGESAVVRLHELAQGVPRRVAQLADLALVAGAGRNLDQIDAETVESVCQELGAVRVEG
jgi:general secretion pathway protein A